MLIYWFLPMILFLGIVTSYEDLKFGKIRNKWIVLGLVYAIFFNLIFLIIGNIVLMDFLKWILYSVIALIIGFSIWIFNLWSAGDAKLFFAYAILIPNSYFLNSNYFNSLNILVNTFALFLIYFLIYIFYKQNWENFVVAGKKLFTFKNIVMLILYVFGVSWIVHSIIRFFGLRADFVMVLVFLFILFYLFSLLKINLLYIYFSFSILRLIFDKSIYSINSIISLIYTLIFFIIIRLFLSFESYFFTEKIPLKKVKAGMMPADIIFKKGKKYFLKPISARTIINFYSGKKINYLFEPKSEGLTEKEAKKLRNLPKLPFKTIRIQKTSPFALYLFIGVLLTLITRGNLIYYIVKDINFRTI